MMLNIAINLQIYIFIVVNESDSFTCITRHFTEIYFRFILSFILFV
jgi:hypothetical protein